MVDVQTGLEPALKKNEETLREHILVGRTTNALLLAQAMGEDMTTPQGAQKVLRHMKLVERHVASDAQ